MAEYMRGYDAGLSIIFTDFPGGTPVPVTGTAIEIAPLGGASVVGPTTVGVGNPETGKYTYTYPIPALQATGFYEAIWTALDAESDPVTGYEIFTIIEALDAGDVAAVPTGRTINTINGLTGGGNLGADLTLEPVYGTTSSTVAEGDDARIVGAQQRSELTTKGDIYVATASATTTRLPVGTDGQALRANSATGTGLEWDTLTAGDVSGAVPDTRTINTINGLTGGGDLTADRTIEPVYGTTANTVAEGDDARIVGAQQRDTIDAKGDLYAGTADATTTRQPVGTDGQVLRANSATGTGLEWDTLTAGDVGAQPLATIDAKGDLYAGIAADTTTRLPVGTDGQVLRANSGTGTGLEWDTLTAAEVDAVPIAGGTMTGPLILSGDPVAALGAATKQYVDAQIAASCGTACEVGEFYSQHWWFADGSIAANQRAAVFLEDQSTFASIFSDPGLTTPLANPTTTDGTGLLTFYAADGRYWVFVGPETSGDSIKIVIGDPDPSDEFQALSTIDAKGDLYVGIGPDATTRLPVGTDGQFLAADSGEPTGLRWVAGGGGGGGSVDSVNGVGPDGFGNVQLTPGDVDAIANAIVDAKGDIVTATANDAPARLPVGTDGQALRANSATATGLEWDTLTAGDVGADPAGSAAAAAAASQPLATIDAKGDLYAGTAADTTTRLPVGTDGQVLRANSATGTGLEWATLSSSGDVVGPGSATDNAIARFDGATGKLIQNSAVTVTDAGAAVLPALTSPAHAPGQLFYDSVSRALSFHNDETAITMNIGQESWVEVRNTTGSTITDGQAVYINGTHASGIPTVALALANSETTSVAVGLATHSIENNTNGFITTDGVVHDLNTSAFAGGDVLFLSATTPGGLVTTPPTSPNIRYRMGVVTKANPTTGGIYVDPGIRRLGNGTANQVLGMNAAANAEEYKTLQGTASRLTVTHGVGTVTFDVDNAALTSPLPFALEPFDTRLIQLVAGTTFNVASPGNNTLYYIPISLTKNATLIEINAEISGTAGTAGAIFWTGMWNADALLLPTGTPFVSFGNQAADSVGTKTWTVSQALVKHTQYYLGFVTQLATPTAPTVRRVITGPGNPVISSTAILTTGNNLCYVQTGVVANPPGAPGTINPNGDLPRLHVKFDI